MITAAILEMLHICNRFKTYSNDELCFTFQAAAEAKLKAQKEAEEKVR